MKQHGIIARAFALAAAEVLRVNVGRRATYATLAAAERNDDAHIAAAQAKRERRAKKRTRDALEPTP